MTTLPITCPSCGVTNPVGKQMCGECDTPLDGSQTTSTTSQPLGNRTGRQTHGMRYSVYLTKPNLSPIKFDARTLWKLFRNSETPTVDARVTTDEIRIEGFGVIPISSISSCEYIEPEPAHETMWHTFEEVDWVSSVGLDYISDDGAPESVRLWVRKGYMPGVDAAARLYASIAEAHGNLEERGPVDADFGTPPPVAEPPPVAQSAAGERVLSELSVRSENVPT